MGERPFGESEPSPSELHFVLGALIAASIALYARPCGARGVGLGDGGGFRGGRRAPRGMLSIKFRS